MLGGESRALGVAERRQIAQQLVNRAKARIGEIEKSVTAPAEAPVAKSPTSYKVGIPEKDGTFSYVDATEVRRIPEQAKVGRIPVGGRELGLVNLMDMIQEAIEKHSPKRVVVDSISDLVFRYPKMEERRPVVLDLVETLQGTKATCLMTSELLSTGEGRLLQPEEYLAEGVIILRTIQKGARAIQILKMRGSKVDTHPRPYVISSKGIEVLATEEVY